ncbi:MAG: hypothetical protein CM15mP18_1320 [Methanobacteriota archaeon]|nr:MAG: hypothetical protein CM15mP18_1320 [Euryarchaeota archaeon]
MERPRTPVEQRIGFPVKGPTPRPTGPGGPLPPCRTWRGWSPSSCRGTPVWQDVILGHPPFLRPDRTRRFAMKAAPHAAPERGKHDRRHRHGGHGHSRGPSRGTKAETGPAGRQGKMAGPNPKKRWRAPGGFGDEPFFGGSPSVFPGGGIPGPKFRAPMDKGAQEHRWAPPTKTLPQKPPPRPLAPGGLRRKGKSLNTKGEIRGDRGLGSPTTMTTIVPGSPPSRP